MAYSNDLTQIRSGLVNYIGACIQASPFEGKAARHTMVSILIEEALKLSQEKEEEPFDMYVLKPMLRGMIAIYQQRASEIEKLPQSEQTKEAIQNYRKQEEFITQWLKNL